MRITEKNNVKIIKMSEEEYNDFIESCMSDVENFYEECSVYAKNVIDEDDMESIMGTLERNEEFENLVYFAKCNLPLNREQFKTVIMKQNDYYVSDEATLFADSLKDYVLTELARAVIKFRREKKEEVA